MLKGEKTGTHHTDKTVERKEGQGEGGQPLRRVLMPMKMLTKSKTVTVPLGSQSMWNTSKCTYLNATLVLLDVMLGFDRVSFKALRADQLLFPFIPFSLKLRKGQCTCIA